MENKPESPRWLDWVGGVFFVGVLSIWLYTVLLRLNYPYDLEWMEGGMLIHALRIQQGLGIYVQPSSDFIPYIYPPLYPTLLAWLSEIWTLDYWMGRGVSIIGTLLATGAVVQAIRQESNSWLLSWLGGALWLSTYEDVGTFFDLTRADGLMMGLLSWSVVLVRQQRLAWAGILCWLAFLSKHNAAIVGAPIAIWLWRTQSWQRALQFGLWSAVPALLSVGWLQYITDGLFLAYLLEVPSHHPIVGQRLVWMSEMEMLKPFALPVVVLSLYGIRALWGVARWRGVLWTFGLLCIGVMTQLDQSVFPKIAGSHKVGQIPFAVVCWLMVGISWLRPSLILDWWNQKQSQPDKTMWDFWWLVTLTLVVFSALMRGHHGGFTNVLMPGIWALSVLVPLLLWRLLSNVKVMIALLMGQIGFGLWSVQNFLPTTEDRLAGDALVAELKVAQGPVWVPHSPWLAVQAGYPPTVHLIALWDIDHTDGPFENDVASIKNDIASHRWGTIVSADKRLGFGLNQHYQYHQSIRPKGRTFLPKVGWKVRPSYVYRPKRSSE